MLSTVNLSFQNILKNIDLNFYQGGIFGILGPNGSGKTTFLKTLAKLWEPTQGNVYWLQEDLHKKTRLEISRIISFIPQQPQIPFDFTSREVIEMGLYPHKKNLANKEYQEKVGTALKMVKANEFADRPLSQLSSGERQRIYIARGLVVDSPVLLLDEPTANLDLAHRIAIWEILSLFRLQGKILVVALHDLQAAERYCDKVALFDQGRCLAFDQFKEIINTPVYQHTFGIDIIQDYQNKS